MGKQNIFLTGASGTLGKPVLRALAATGEFEVHCLARSGAAESLVASLGGLPVRGAMEDRGLFEELRPSVRPLPTSLEPMAMEKTFASKIIAAR